MIGWLKEKRKKVHTWTVSHARKKSAIVWLAAVSFMESSFFPIPPDFILVPMVLADRKNKWAWFALVTTISSVLGAMFGYMIGSIFSPLAEKLIEFYGLQEQFQHVNGMFNDGAAVALFVSAFTPIPFKVFTIASGFFSVKFSTLVLASFAGRGLRFFTEAFLIHKFGPAISKTYHKHINIISIIFVVFVAVLVFVLLR